MTDRYYLTTDIDEATGEIVAMITIGHARRGDKHVILCAIAHFKTQPEVDRWFDEQLAEKMWWDTLPEDYRTLVFDPKKGERRVPH